MNKEELLSELSGKINRGEITREEVANFLSLAPAAQPVSVAAEMKNEKHFSVNKVLYALGAAIVVIGIVLFASQVWNNIGSLGRISITLGLGLLLTVLGSFLVKNKPEDVIGPVFYGMGGLLIPGGALVTLHEIFGSYYMSLWPTTLTFGAIFAFYLLFNFVNRHAVLTLFCIFTGTSFLYLLFESIVAGAFYTHFQLYAYLTMVVGASYLLLANSFSEGWNKKLVGSLYFLGTLMFLGAAFSRVFNSAPWQMLYFLLVIGGLFLAVYLRSKAVLAISTIFLIMHISYITSQYFASSLGWPISLVILGFVFIGLGYLSININKKYIRN